MGIFISNCKECKNELHWFLEANDTVCEECKTLNTASEVELSFAWNLVHNKQEKLNELSNIRIKYKELRKELTKQKIEHDNRCEDQYDTWPMAMAYAFEEALKLMDDFDKKYPS